MPGGAASISLVTSPNMAAFVPTASAKVRTTPAANVGSRRHVRTAYLTSVAVLDDLIDRQSTVSPAWVRLFFRSVRPLFEAIDATDGRLQPPLRDEPTEARDERRNRPRRREKMRG